MASFLNRIKNYFFSSSIAEHFDILHKLGSGGYGKVYLACNRRDNQRVAIKKVKKSKISEYVPTGSGDIPLEIFISLSLDHPNIVQTLGYCETKRHWFTIMEHCNGYMDLTTFLDLQGSNLTQKSCRKIFLQTYRALTHCFRMNVAHRDVKTDNVLVHWETAHVKLIDFGISTFFRCDTPIDEKRGTDIFLPPELYLHHTYDPLEGTVWALGCLLFCLLYGEVPFENIKEVVKKDPFLEHSDNYILPVYDLLRACLQKETKQRITYRDISCHSWITKKYQF